MTFIENNYDPHVPWVSPIETLELREAEARLFSIRGSIEVTSRVSTGDALLHVAHSIKNVEDLRVVIRYILNANLQYIECASSSDAALVVADEACSYVRELLKGFLRKSDIKWREKRIEEISKELTERQLEYCFPERHEPEKKKKLEKGIEFVKNRLEVEEKCYYRDVQLRKEAEVAIEVYASLLSHINQAKESISSPSS